MMTPTDFPGDEVVIRHDNLKLAGFLYVPRTANGLVLFAHGSGSSRHSSRNQFVARQLADASLATLLLDLLTPSEDAIDQHSAAFRFNIPLLSQRLVVATNWSHEHDLTRHLSVGHFGASTGAAAALIAASQRSDLVKAVVSRGGRPDLAADALRLVRAPVLLIVGGYDDQVLHLNRIAAAQLGGKNEILVIPKASHLFEEPGTLEQVAIAARDWFLTYLGGHAQSV